MAGSDFGREKSTTDYLHMGGRGLSDWGPCIEGREPGFELAR
jgi:hypothetical protein